MSRVALALLISVAAVAGCSKTPPPAAQPPASASTSLSPSAEPPVATPTSTPGAAPGCAGNVSGGSDPSRAALKAWLCNDSAAMTAKLNDSAKSQLNAVGKDIDLQWTFVSCDGAAGSSYCRYRNVFGSDLILRNPTSNTAKVTEVKFDRTIFHASAADYTKHFVDAWINGNAPRMQALTTAGALSFAVSHPVPAPGYTSTLSPSEVYIFEVESSGADYRIVLQNPLGKSGAITAISAM